MGFVPLAFRAGSRQKGRVHIFWQRRIRFGDETTPYWFPAQTSSGSIREDRLVLPIPPGTHWRDVMPIVLPGEKLPVTSGQLPVEKKSRKRSSLATGNSQLETPTLQKPTSMRKQFAPPSAKPLPESISQPESTQSQSAEKLPKPKKVKQKNDPWLIAAARELRDRWLEKVNDDPGLLISCGKYEVSRAIEEGRKGQPALEIPHNPPLILPAVAARGNLTTAPAPAHPLALWVAESGSGEGWMSKAEGFTAGDL